MRVLLYLLLPMVDLILLLILVIEPVANADVKSSLGILIFSDYLRHVSKKHPMSVRYRSLRPPAKHILHNFEFLCKLTHPALCDRY